tara:strand:- start:314 stop:1222 length:909 start_codon:yes stop_codon:yes gene_type:complete
MNNILSRFYFFSKLATSLILLILLIFLSYLFVRAYLGKKHIDSMNLQKEELSNKITRLSNSIEQNSNNLNSIKELVLENKKSVKEINTNIQKLNEDIPSNNTSIQIEELFKKNKIMKEELYNMSSLINTINSSESSTYQTKELIIIKKNIIKLIKLKLDSGLNFKEESNSLRNFINNEEQLSSLDKLSIYATEKFWGVDELNKNFDDIASHYLNDYYLKKNKNFFIKNFLNLFKFQPNLNSNIKNEIVLQLSLAKQSLINKNYNKSVEQINNLNDSNDYFVEWINQANYYYQVIDLLEKLKI